MHRLSRLAWHAGMRRVLLTELCLSFPQHPLLAGELANTCNRITWLLKRTRGLGRAQELLGEVCTSDVGRLRDWKLEALAAFEAFYAYHVPAALHAALVYNGMMTGATAAERAR